MYLNRGSHVGVYDDATRNIYLICHGDVNSFPPRLPMPGESLRFRRRLIAPYRLMGYCGARGQDESCFMIPSERESSVDSTADTSAEAHEDVGAEVQSVQRALKEEQQRNLRLLADFDNFRRRVARERETVRLEGQRAALLPVLPVLDSLERALAAGSTDPEFYEGVVATHRLFVSALREAGAEPIQSVGRPFDPSIHEAVSTVASDGVQPGTITREVRRGWQLGDSVLRPAQVVVAVTREPDDPWR